MGELWDVSGGGASGPSVAVKDEGVAVATPSVLDFVGAGVVATDAGGGTVTVTINGSALTTEQIQDIVGAFVVAGAGIAVTYDDPGNTLTIAVSGLTSATLSDFTEAVQDVVGALALGGSGLTATYNDAANTLVIDVNVDGSSIEVNADTLRVKAAGITNAMLAGSIALSKLATDPLARANHTGTQPASTISDFPSGETLLGPTGCIAGNIPRSMLGGDAGVLSTGRLTLVAVYLRAGQVVNSITWFSGGTPAGTPTHQWFCLYDKNRGKLAVTSDDTTTAWAASTPKTLSLTAPYTVLTSDLYYVGIVVTATTVPSIKGILSIVATVTGAAPIIAGTSDSGLTDPASAPTTAAALTALAACPAAFLA